MPKTEDRPVMSREQAEERRRTTYDDAYGGKVEERQWEGGGYMGQENGRSYFYAECPFCESDVRCFPWSMAGCGKRCDCGALLLYAGQAFKKYPKEVLDTLSGDS